MSAAGYSKRCATAKQPKNRGKSYWFAQPEAPTLCRDVPTTSIELQVDPWIAAQVSLIARLFSGGTSRAWLPHPCGFDSSPGARGGTCGARCSTKGLLDEDST